MSTMNRRRFLGIAGGAIAVVAYYALGSVALASYLWSGKSVVRLSFDGIRFRWPLFRDILRVGAVAALITIQTNLTIAIATGLTRNQVGRTANSPELKNLAKHTTMIFVFGL